LPRCPEARGNIFNPDPTLTRKLFELSGHAARPSRIVCVPSNGFRAAVYDSIGPPLAFMIVNSGTRWLPEPETFGSKSGRGCRRKAQAGHQPHSFGGHPNGAQALQKSRVIGRLKLLRNLGDSLETPGCCLLSKWPPTPWCPAAQEVGSGGRRADPSRRPLLIPAVFQSK
jgi:hypothetical protein